MIPKLAFLIYMVLLSWCQDILFIITNKAFSGKWAVNS